MKKTTNDELNQWHFQYPSTTVSWNLTGDPAYCQRFVGEAKNMLYQLKNRMNIAVPKLKSLQDKRSPVPGTTIIVKSIFGQDFIEISAGKGKGISSCSITLLNIPEVIPPMKWYAYGRETWTKVGNAWVIKDPNGVIEVEGIDYIKTYYRLKVKDCSECQPLDFSICESDELALPQCHPYTYDATKLLYQGNPVPYFQGSPLRVPPVPPDPENHLIHSFYDYGQAEIIKFGSDSQGTYFLWKAYTEWGTYPPTEITFSRTGLGYLLLKAFIRFEEKDLCQIQSIIKVDCCLKDVDSRKVEIWWEDFGTCQPYIIYEGVVYDAICKMPTDVPMGGTAGLAWYGCTHPQQPLYAIPEIKGSCLPVEWTLSGPIELWGSDKNDNIIYFRCLEGGCNEEATITLRDRCGTEYIVRGRPCCEDTAALSINYTSLLMACSQQQTLYAIGGCGPYAWSLSGGGSLNTNVGGEVIYTAPATNPNCTSNPTITVVDCCGVSAQIQLAVNCYTGSEAAFEYDIVLQNSCGWTLLSGEWACRWSGSAEYKNWDCAGNLIYDYSYTLTNYGLVYDAGGGCNTYCFDSGCCSAECAAGPQGRCSTTPRGLPWAGLDVRTTDMKNAGCCPLNPLTGLPY